MNDRGHGPSTIELARHLIVQGEGTGPKRGRQFLVYDDATGRPIERGSVVEGHPTIGYGYNIGELGIGEAIVVELLDERLGAAVDDATFFLGQDGLSRLSAARQAAIIDMAYNLGRARLGSFRKLEEAILMGDFERASMEILSSLYAKQVKARALRNAEIMKTDDLAAGEAFMGARADA